jgi:DNA-binding response OmpR family regulator
MKSARPRTGPKGLAITDSEHVDAVILDYKMPGMDGGTVARELRAKHPEIPILLLSGFPGEIPQPVLESVDSFIVKGTAPATLLDEVERLTGRKGAGTSQTETLEGGKKPQERSEDLLQNPRHKHHH